ncbi:MAG: GNAT family N-acetyltransferase [Rudaea sp.]|uniref:GNAT family N-acetyltransferase n=1 Tax=Rudaea sp. TaxID=2136325 RepID=UPI0039E40879
MTAVRELPNEAAAEFRIATLGDIPAIEKLVTSAYRGDASRAGWTTEADLLDGQRVDAAAIAEIIDKPGSLVLLLSPPTGAMNRTPTACCHVEKQGDACYFGMFAVEPGLQGGGVGKLVMAEAERIAREDFGCARMEMTVISVRDELIAWYERRGYRRTGKYKPFPYGDERFGIPKRDDLKFELLVKDL